MEGGLEILSPAWPSCVSSKGDGRGFGTPTQASPLEILMDSPASCVSEGRGGGSGSMFSTPTGASSLETQLKSPSSCVSDSRGDGSGSGFSSLTRASQRETRPDSPSSCVSDSRGGRKSSALRVSKEREVQEAERLLRAITERYNDCFLRLRDATSELVDLRRERVRLRAENLQLSLRLVELEAEQSKQTSAVALAPPPKPVQVEAAFGWAPMSISIRSKGFLSKQQQQQRDESKPQRLRVRASLAVEEVGEKETEEGQVELEAYCQGALKTELCNKWERGACPYAGRCRFAHGVQELRPVIRHPRYKTLPCQMFIAPSGCPYGHRCHFRHSAPPTADSC